jgi:hypothetical protein
MIRGETHIGRPWRDHASSGSIDMHVPQSGLVQRLSGPILFHFALR